MVVPEETDEAPTVESEGHFAASDAPEASDVTEWASSET
jgi:hypothetical protein